MHHQSMMLDGCSSREPWDRSLLVIAHPGHELRLFDWLGTTQPDVVVLTDGSGSAGQSRIDATRRVLAASGARCTPLFGAHTDQEIYHAMLCGDTALFVEMTLQLILQLRRGRYHRVVADPFEGYNPTHDLCRLLTNVAVLWVRHRHGQRVRSFDFPLTELSSFPESSRLSRHGLSLYAQMRKKATVDAYVELTAEIESVVANEGHRVFEEEILRELEFERHTIIPSLKEPFYEAYGERQRAAGRYSRVLRYHEHFLPIVTAVTALLELPMSQSIGPPTAQPIGPPIVSPPSRISIPENSAS